MAIEMTNTTKILAGVVVLAVAGAGAWFFLFEEDAPPPRTVITSKGTAAKAKAAPAPAADAPKAGDAAKAADAPKAAEAPKPAAQVKPIPTNPDRLIAEIVEAWGVKAGFQAFARGAGRTAATVNKPAEYKPTEADAKEFTDIAARVFDADTMTAEVAARMKTAYETERMTRLLENLRQPAVVKLKALDARSMTVEEGAKAMEEVRKNPPPAARQKLIHSLDELQKESESAEQVFTLLARELVDAMLTGMEKAGARVPKEARQEAGSRIAAAQAGMRSHFRTALLVNYRDASDEDLAEYLKYVDTDTGRWGVELLLSAERAAIDSRVRQFAQEVAKVEVSRQLADLAAGKRAAKAPAAPVLEPLAKAQPEAPAEKPADSAAAVPAEPVGYRRPANIRNLYSRYNDLKTAVVMGDSAAVKELLDDGKDPNARQSDGITPLMIAANRNDLAIATMLLAKGADPNVRAAGGMSALAIAKARGVAGGPMVQLLQRSGARE